MICPHAVDKAASLFEGLTLSVLLKAKQKQISSLQDLVL